MLLFKISPNIYQDVHIISLRKCGDLKVTASNLEEPRGDFNYREFMFISNHFPICEFSCCLFQHEFYSCQCRSLFTNCSLANVPTFQYYLIMCCQLFLSNVLLSFVSCFVHAIY